MKLYFCRKKADSDTYMGRLLVTRAGYIATKEVDEISFSSDRAAMEETARQYPELEVCCLDAEPQPIAEGVHTMQLQ